MVMAVILYPRRFMVPARQTLRLYRYHTALLDSLSQCTANGCIRMAVLCFLPEDFPRQHSKTNRTAAYGRFFPAGYILRHHRRRSFTSLIRSGFPDAFGNMQRREILSIPFPCRSDCSCYFSYQGVKYCNHNFCRRRHYLQNNTIRGT